MKNASSESGEHKERSNFWFGFALLLLLVGVVAFFNISELQPVKQVRHKIQSVVDSPKETPTPTPYPFSDLTIPALRDHQYESHLEERETVSENDEYTSYTTSYGSDNLQINGLLTIPSGDTPEGGWPAIVFVHGYLPPDQYETLGRPYESYVDYLARNSFVVFKIDLRGHGDSEGESGGAYYSADYVIDTLNAYAALESSDFVNPERVGLWGHSMAGNVVMRSMATKPSIPAVVIWDGAVYSYSDWEKYGLNDASYQPPDEDSERTRLRRQIRELYGEPGSDTMFWRQIAPTSYLADLQGTLQIHHALDDEVVDIGYSRDLMTLLDKTKVPHELYEYDSGGHNISGSSFVTAMERTVVFFKNQLSIEE